MLPSCLLEGQPDRSPGSLRGHEAERLEPQCDDICSHHCLLEGQRDKKDLGSLRGHETERLEAQRDSILCSRQCSCEGPADKEAELSAARGDHVHTPIFLARRATRKKARGVLADTKPSGLNHSVITYNALVSACEGQADRESHARLRKVKQSRCSRMESPTALLSVLVQKEEQREKASLVFPSMKQSGLRPDVIPYSALARACTKGNQTARALEVFAGMQQNSLKPNVITYSSLISACENGDHTKRPWMYPSQRQWSLSANVIAGGAVISVCSKGNQT